MNYSAHQERFQMSDEALFEMLREDHAWALKEIFERHNLRLFRMAAGVLNDDDQAKDLVQDVFVDLWNRRHTSNVQILSHYLSRAIKFQVLKQLRNGKLQEHHLKLAQKVQFANQTEELLNFQELEEQLQKAIAVLPTRCKEVFFLSRYQNLSHKEISTRLKISPKTVEAQIGKALTFLRSKLEGIVLMVAMLFL
ncbi:RNA polymerase sigma-70 factor [Chryseolinea lacunae]|uniref:RNA polymerase sigma-70 factor n=1 Tax=Chryseolinea lacunae TaxID=2801331 RepID=A0ABS1KL39_9BACT|nr:RNA polymerase sigma-70 factor [Chryseolinea lacunae]MBL0740178.1 RNA polymerase sigma-70 factor [Chryseolinea lacunae]